MWQSYKKEIDVIKGMVFVPKNITQGKKQTDRGYLTNENGDILSPKGEYHLSFSDREPKVLFKGNKEYKIFRLVGGQNALGEPHICLDSVVNGSMMHVLLSPKEFEASVIIPSYEQTISKNNDKDTEEFTK